MTVLATVSCSTACFFLAAHAATLLVAGVRCRPGARRAGVGDGTGDPVPAVTAVFPLRGVETFSRRTLDAALRLDHPTHEVIFCVADAADPVVPLVEAAIAAHPGVAARLLVGEDRIGANPKLNNMVKGWRHAAHPWIAFIDSNVLVPPNVLGGLTAALRADTGAVSAPPCGIEPAGFAAHLECAFLNTHEARWQYVVDSLGRGFAQGKTLFYHRDDLDRSAMRELAAEPAEDAATTRMVRRMGKRVRLAPPSPLPLGRRSLRSVWGRQLRWARLRRATFPLEFLPEVLAGAAVPALTAGAAAMALGWPVAATVAAYLAAWYAAEVALALVCRWPVGPWTLPALLARDIALPALYLGAFGRSFTWNGAVLRLDPPNRPLARPLGPRSRRGA